MPGGYRKSAIFPNSKKCPLNLTAKEIKLYGKCMN
jgi:hypothetical protein